MKASQQSSSSTNSQLSANQVTLTKRLPTAGQPASTGQALVQSSFASGGRSKTASATKESVKPMSVSKKRKESSEDEDYERCLIEEDDEEESV